MNNNLLTDIEAKMPEFSKSQRYLADFIINHYEKASFMTAAKLGAAVNVSESTVVRFAIEMLMKHYLDDGFSDEMPHLVLDATNDEYYVKMMAAWYFATALAKRYDDIIGYIEKGLPDIWVHNKTIQKATESYRISDEKKRYLKTLKR